MNPNDTPNDIAADQPVFIALSRDLFFGMRTRTVLRKMGHDVVLVNDEQRLLEAVSEASPALVFIDFNQPVDWEALQPLLTSDVPTVAFGSHTDVEGFRAARAAGVSRVTSNGDFSRRLPELVERYKAKP